MADIQASSKKSYLKLIAKILCIDCAEKIFRRYIQIGTFILSIAAVAVYLIFVIPHSVTTTEIAQEGIRHEMITIYPLSAKAYFAESLKIFCIINIPNMIFLIRKMNRRITGSG